MSMGFSEVIDEAMPVLLALYRMTIIGGWRDGNLTFCYHYHSRCHGSSFSQFGVLRRGTPPISIVFAELPCCANKYTNPNRCGRKEVGVAAHRYSNKKVICQ